MAKQLSHMEFEDKRKGGLNNRREKRPQLRNGSHLEVLELKNTGAENLTSTVRAQKQLGDAQAENNSS